MAALRGARALWLRVSGGARAGSGRTRLGACLGAAAGAGLYLWYRSGARGTTPRQHWRGLDLLPALRARGHDKEDEEGEGEVSAGTRTAQNATCTYLHTHQSQVPETQQRERDYRLID